MTRWRLMEWEVAVVDWQKRRLKSQSTADDVDDFEGSSYQGAYSDVTPGEGLALPLVYRWTGAK